MCARKLSIRKVFLLLELYRLMNLLCCLGNLRNHIFTHTNSRPYRCDRCDAGFNQRSNLMCHKQKVRKLKGVVCIFTDFFFWLYFFTNVFYYFQNFFAFLIAEYLFFFVIMFEISIERYL